MLVKFKDLIQQLIKHELYKINKEKKFGLLM